MSEVVAKKGNRCFYCGVPESLCVDEISEGVFVPCCALCKQIKGSMTPSEFISLVLNRASECHTPSPRNGADCV